MWIWIVNVCVYAAIITTYFCIDGHEIIYSMYIPLDILLNVSKALFYFFHWNRDRKEKLKQDELKNELQKKIKSKLAQQLLMIKSRTSEGGASSEVSNPGQELDEKRHIQMQL